MIWEKNAWGNSIKIFFVNFSVCYKFVMIIMQSAKFAKQFFLIKFCQAFSFQIIDPGHVLER